VVKFYWAHVVQAFAEALMVIPKILAQNSGFDPQDTTVKLQVSSMVMCNLISERGQNMHFENQKLFISATVGTI